MLTIWTLPFKFRSPPLDSRFRLNHWWSPKGSSHPLRPPILPLLRSPIKRGHNGTPPTAPCPPPSLFRPNNFTLLQSALPRLSYLTRENILALNNHQELQVQLGSRVFVKEIHQRGSEFGYSRTRKKALLKNIDAICPLLLLTTGPIHCDFLLLLPSLWFRKLAL